ncbi:MAG: AAA family ATPase [Actinobacteria bacterium]|nr:AAA family ATPase [Actinomycetota bacterium]
MAISPQMRRLQSRWNQDTMWPKRLEWIEIGGMRGWNGQRFSFPFPIMAVVGENGAGKSTILQAAGSIYRPPGPVTLKGERASKFFPDTAWDHIRNAEIRAHIKEGDTHTTTSVRKLTDRWRGNPERRERDVVYIDLSRVQPVLGRMGYAKLANAQLTEADATPFEESELGRFCAILDKRYEGVKMATTNADESRAVPVIAGTNGEFSGYHQGAGETALIELLTTDLPRYSLVLIDEIESSLHPRMQRRLIRDLAHICRLKELQIVLTSHSPYVLEELPSEARAHILVSAEGRREIVYGVSPEFSMTRMDDVPHHECDVYVEDDEAAKLLVEILATKGPELVRQCQIIPFGAANVGSSLGQMVAGKRFRRPTVVFLDADQGQDAGCHLLPGDDAPERVVFPALAALNWPHMAERTNRPHADVADACTKAMLLGDHHDWVRTAASDLTLGGDFLWQVMCAEWVRSCLNEDEATRVVQAVEDAITMEMGVSPMVPEVIPAAPLAEDRDDVADPSPSSVESANESGQLFPL